MRILLTLSLFLTLATACDRHKDPKPVPRTIPKDIPFNEKILPVISDADFVEAKAAFKIVNFAGKIEKQMLIPQDEDQSAKAEREAEFQKLSPERQQLVTELRTSCQTQPFLNTTPMPNPPQVGSQSTTYGQNQLMGPACPAKMSQSVAMTATITEMGNKIAMTMTGKISGNTVYTKPEHDVAAGVHSFTGTGAVDGLLEIANGGMSMYVRMTGTGNFQPPAGGGGAPIDVNVNAEQLSTNELNKSLSKYIATQSGKTFQLTTFEDSSRGMPTSRRHFLGNRELTPAEVEEIGVPDEGSQAKPVLKNLLPN